MAFIRIYLFLLAHFFLIYQEAFVAFHISGCLQHHIRLNILPNFIRSSFAPTFLLSFYFSICHVRKACGQPDLVLHLNHI
jgi:hypothetical protein